MVLLVVLRERRSVVDVLVLRAHVKRLHLAIPTPVDSAPKIAASQNTTMELHLGGYKYSSFLNDSFIFINLHWT